MAHIQNVIKMDSTVLLYNIAKCKLVSAILRHANKTTHKV